MSLLTTNIIPGNHGKDFGTNAIEESDLTDIKKKLLEFEGITRVALNMDVFPREFTVYTKKVIGISEVEKIVKSIGFHAIPKDTL